MHYLQGATADKNSVLNLFSCHGIDYALLNYALQPSAKGVTNNRKKGLYVTKHDSN